MDKRRSPRESFAGRLPPQNLEAEQGVLGSILLSHEELDDVVEVLRPDHFYSEANQRIFEAVMRLHERGVKGDAVTLSEELTRNGDMEVVGGDQYLIQVLEAVPNAAHARYYADIVRYRWIQRTLANSCN